MSKINSQLHYEIDNRLRYHPPTPESQPIFIANRARFLELAHYLVDALPEGRHKSLALTALQEALMWSNAAVACDLVDADQLRLKTEHSVPPMMVDENVLD